MILEEIEARRDEDDPDYQYDPDDLDDEDRSDVASPARAKTPLFLPSPSPPQTPAHGAPGAGGASMLDLGNPRQRQVFEFNAHQAFGHANDQLLSPMSPPTEQDLQSRPQDPPSPLQSRRPGSRTLPPLSQVLGSSSSLPSTTTVPGQGHSGSAEEPSQAGRR